MSDDFLSLDDDEARAAQRAAALETASLYLVFVTDERGRQLLALWDDTLGRKRLPPTASVQEFAYAEAQRAFVDGIHRQIELARELKGAVG